MSVPATSFITPEEYLAAERTSTERHEYVNGRVYPMYKQVEGLAGASRAHVLISANLVRELGNQLRGGACELYANDMRVKVAVTGMYTYPDLVVACGSPRFEGEREETLLDPTLIVEILSPSTEAYDRGEKFAHYRQLPSLTAYVLVAQDRPAVERFVRRGDGWVLGETVGLDAAVPLDAIGCTLPMRAIYDRVTFPADGQRGPVVA